MLLWIYALGVAFVSAVVLLQYAGIDVISSAIRITDEGAAVATLFLLVSIFFLFYRSRGGRGRDGREPLSVTHKMENGDVKITYDTLEQLATRAAMKLRGVQDLKTRVRVNEGGALVIAMKFAIEADLDIPKTTAELQTSVKEYIEGTAGLKVEQVTVYVTELSAQPEAAKKRVQ
jgi:uncharacterized alkaline shock family protein YloU